MKLYTSTYSTMAAMRWDFTLTFSVFSISTLIKCFTTSNRISNGTHIHCLMPFELPLFVEIDSCQTIWNSLNVTIKYENVHKIIEIKTHSLPQYFVHFVSIFVHLLIAHSCSLLKYIKIVSEFMQFEMENSIFLNPISITNQQKKIPTKKLLWRVHFISLCYSLIIIMKIATVYSIRSRSMWMRTESEREKISRWKKKTIAN